MAIEMPHVAGHPNRLPFRGVLTLLDVPSDKPPAGARGHRVMLTRAAAEKALPSLLGMALDFTPNLDGHDARRKVGVITSADIVPAGAPPSAGAQRRLRVGLFSPDAIPSRPAENPHPSPKEGRGWGTIGGHSAPWQLEIAGYIFARDFPDVVGLMRGSEAAEPALRQNSTKDGASAPSELGMSYEIANARVADVNAAVWTLTEATFTGAAMLLRSKAAYAATWIELDDVSEGRGLSRAVHSETEARL